MRCGATRLHERPPARHQKHSQAREAQKLLGIDSDSDDEADVRTSGKGEMGKAASAARPKVGSVGAAAKATPTYGVPKPKPKPVSAKPQKARHLHGVGVVVLHRLWLHFHDVCIGNQDNRSWRHEGTSGSGTAAARPEYC